MLKAHEHGEGIDIVTFCVKITTKKEGNMFDKKAYQKEYMRTYMRKYRKTAKYRKWHNEYEKAKYRRRKHGDD